MDSPKLCFAVAHGVAEVARVRRRRAPEGAEHEVVVAGHAMLAHGAAVCVHETPVVLAPMLVVLLDRATHDRRARAPGLVPGQRRRQKGQWPMVSAKEFGMSRGAPVAGGLAGSRRRSDRCKHQQRKHFLPKMATKISVAPFK